MVNKVKGFGQVKLNQGKKTTFLLGLIDFFSGSRPN